MFLTNQAGSYTRHASLHFRHSSEIRALWRFYAIDQRVNLAFSVLGRLAVVRPANWSGLVRLKGLGWSDLAEYENLPTHQSNPQKSTVLHDFRVFRQSPRCCKSL